MTCRAHFLKRPSTPSLLFLSSSLTLLLGYVDTDDLPSRAHLGRTGCAGFLQRARRSAQARLSSFPPSPPSFTSSRPFRSHSVRSNRVPVDKQADDPTIKKAYKKLARKYHPDKNKEPQAIEKFAAVSHGSSTSPTCFTPLPPALHCSQSWP